MARCLNTLVETEDIDEIVILLDECEQLPWLGEVVDFTRLFASPRLRFCLALRDSHADGLVDSRRGDYRFVSKVRVAPLALPDMRALFDTVASRLRSQDIFWTVGDDALAFIAHHSGGEPWYLQMIGHELLFRTVARTGGLVPVGEMGILCTTGAGQRGRAEDVRRKVERTPRCALRGVGATGAEA